MASRRRWSPVADWYVLRRMVTAARNWTSCAPSRGAAPELGRQQGSFGVVSVRNEATLGASALAIGKVPPLAYNRALYLPEPTCKQNRY